MSFLQLLLIHFDADCTQPDSVGNTPLHMCVDSGHEDVSYCKPTFIRNDFICDLQMKNWFATIIFRDHTLTTLILI